MFEASADDRGTVQSLARELDAANEDGMLYIYPIKKVANVSPFHMQLMLSFHSALVSNARCLIQLFMLKFYAT
jgi:hypothetical protein